VAEEAEVGVEEGVVVVVVLLAPEDAGRGMVISNGVLPEDDPEAGVVRRDPDAGAWPVARALRRAWAEEVGTEGAVGEVEEGSG